MFKILGDNKTPKDLAKDRLKLILIHDRGDLSNDIVEKMRAELLDVLSKYIDIGLEDIDITVKNASEIEGVSSSLVANIPIRNVKAK